MAHPYTTKFRVRTKVKDNIKEEFNDSVLDELIEESDSIIDSYLNQYYDVTQLSSTIGIISTLSTIISSGMITGTTFQDFDQSASTWESKLLNQAKNILKLIQDGTMSIPGLTRIGV